MVRKTFTRNKLNSEKGVTGVDIVVSVTMIVISIAVVMAIFVNISSTSREVNRTSGATRMATNILENIELMYYEDFIKYLKEDLSHKTYDLNGTTKNIYTEETYGVSDYNGTYLIPGEEFTGEKFFNTKIPNGYTLKLVVSNVYGENNTTKYDLVRKVNVSILFDASGREKDVTLSTTKTFERLDSLYNKSTNDLKCFHNMKTADVQKYNNNVSSGKAAIMYVEETNVSGTIKYKTNTDLSSTYSYGEYITDEIKPVMAVINHNDNIQSGYVKDTRKDQIYIWVPSHKIETIGGTEKIIYEYETYKIGRIKVDKTNIVDGVTLPFITAKKSVEVNGNNIGFKTATGESLTGVWVSIEKLNTYKLATATDFEKKLYNYCKKFVDYELINGI